VTEDPGWDGDRGFRPIESYGVVGDLETVALVGDDGSIDWFCPQRFDAPSIFAGLLDPERAGSFRIAPVGRAARARTKQMYLPDTAVLVTRFSTPEGVAEVVDFMPPAHLQPGRSRRQNHCAIVRRVDVVRGRMTLRMRCRPAFDYAREEHRLVTDDTRATFTGERGSVTALTASIPVQAEGPAAEARFTLSAGQREWFVLHPGGDHHHWSGHAVAASLEAAIAFWRQWIGRCNYSGRWREMVQRSAITLKLLTYEPTGAMVAAPTTSLPETIGGQRNWDYRYSWIRDSSFTAFAFLRLGYVEEARRFSSWLEERCREADEAGEPELQIVYGIDGRRDLAEQELGHLRGYRDSGPVRIGNGAHDQLQLDVYGELMDAIYLLNKAEPISYDLWAALRRLLEWLTENWRRPDNGIWEVRGGEREFVYSRMMCWVAFERAMRIQRDRGLPGPRSSWREARDTIFEEIMDRGWSARRGAFVQYYGGDVLDASALLMPLVKFIGPRDPRMLSTLDAIDRDLVSDSLVYRYDPDSAADDGLGGSEEGSFSLCSFWLVECLTRAGRLDQARLVFEKMQSYASPLGLYAEEVGDTGEALGNYPQAFTHLGLISAAWDLDRALEGELL
jgi:GH15 family glucan-1,4-alpha-glucosidase